MFGRQRSDITRKFIAVYVLRINLCEVFTDVDATAAVRPSPAAPESSHQPRDMRTGYHTDGDGCQTLIHETTCYF